MPRLLALLLALFAAAQATRIAFVTPAQNEVWFNGARSTVLELHNGTNLPSRLHIAFFRANRPWWYIYSRAAYKLSLDDAVVEPTEKGMRIEVPERVIRNLADGTYRAVLRHRFLFWSRTIAKSSPILILKEGVISPFVRGMQATRVHDGVRAIIKFAHIATHLERYEVAVKDSKGTTLAEKHVKFDAKREVDVTFPVDDSAAYVELLLKKPRIRGVVNAKTYCEARIALPSAIRSHALNDVDAFTLDEDDGEMHLPIDPIDGFSDDESDVNGMDGVAEDAVSQHAPSQRKPNPILQVGGAVIGGAGHVVRTPWAVVKGACNFVGRVGGAVVHLTGRGRKCTDAQSVAGDRPRIEDVSDIDARSLGGSPVRPSHNDIADSDDDDEDLVADSEVKDVISENLSDFDGAIPDKDLDRLLREIANDPAYKRLNDDANYSDDSLESAGSRPLFTIYETDNGRDREYEPLDRIESADSGIQSGPLSDLSDADLESDSEDEASQELIRHGPINPVDLDDESVTEQADVYRRSRADVDSAMSGLRSFEVNDFSDEDFSDDELTVHEGPSSTARRAPDSFPDNDISDSDDDEQPFRSPFSRDSMNHRYA